MKNKLNSFAIHTLGCKVNLYESNSIKNDLLEYGLIEVPFTSEADIYIINTCSVTSKADAKSKNIIKRPKRINPNAIVIVMGCFSQTNQELCDELDVDIVIGNKYKNDVISLIERYIRENKKISIVENLMIEKEFENSKVSSFKENTRAFIKIQDGCNFMCSYCIIPFSRGRQRSKSLINIIEEIKDLVKNGYNEVVLTGVNTAGYCDENNNTFYDLLKQISLLDGNFRLRISSVEPFQITDEIIDLITSNRDRFCQHWHLCLQSASDKVLTKMNRKYEFKDFLNLVNKIKYKSPYSTFTTDYIVGFPTESNDDFNESLNNIQKISFLDMHVFPYSPRKGTQASLLKPIDSLLMKNRLNEVEKVKKIMTKNTLDKFKDCELNVLFENENKGYWHGYSSEYISVFVKSNENLKNKIKKVKPSKIRMNYIIGEII